MNDNLNSQENSDESIYLSSGLQTENTPEVNSIVSQFKESAPMERVKEIFSWMKNNLNETRFDRNKFRKRTADQIIKDKDATGCTDYTLVFSSLARASNIPTKYVETVDKSWLEGTETRSNSGHQYAKVFIDGHWLLVDPQYGTRNPEKALQADLDRDGRVLYGEGFDSWDLGINDFDSLLEKFKNFRDGYRGVQS